MRTPTKRVSPTPTRRIRFGKVSAHTPPAGKRLGVRFRFDDDTRAELAQRKMPPDAVLRLERACKITLAQGFFDERLKGPTGSELRGAIREIQATSRKLGEIIGRRSLFGRGRTKTPPPGAIGPSLNELGIDVRRLGVDLYRLERACRHLMSELEGYKQTHSAPLLPIKHIWNALIGTHVNLSSGNESQFRIIAEICYRAMGRSDGEVERPIKQLVRELKPTVRPTREGITRKRAKTNSK